MTTRMIQKVTTLCFLPFFLLLPPLLPFALVSILHRFFSSPFSPITFFNLIFIFAFKPHNLTLTIKPSSLTFTMASPQKVFLGTPQLVYAGKLASIVIQPIPVSHNCKSNRSFFKTILNDNTIHYL